MDDDGRLREHQRRPRHVEEEEVERGGPRGEGLAEEVREDGHGEEDVHGWTMYNPFGEIIIK